MLSSTLTSRDGRDATRPARNGLNKRFGAEAERTDWNPRGSFDRQRFARPSREPCMRRDGNAEGDPNLGRGKPPATVASPLAEGLLQGFLLVRQCVRQRGCLAAVFFQTAASGDRYAFLVVDVPTDDSRGGAKASILLRPVSMHHRGAERRRLASASPDVGFAPARSGSALLSRLATSTREVVRQLSASAHLNVCTPPDARGLRWTECCG